MHGTRKHRCIDCVYNIGYIQGFGRIFGKPIRRCAVKGELLNDDNIFWNLRGMFCKTFLAKEGS